MVIRKVLSVAGINLFRLIRVKHYSDVLSNTGYKLIVKGCGVSVSNLLVKVLKTLIYNTKGVPAPRNFFPSVKKGLLNNSSLVLLF